MRKDSSDYEVWNSNSFLLGKEDSEVAYFLDANKLRLSLMSDVRSLHSVINMAMTTSLISYQLNKVEGKS